MINRNIKYNLVIIEVLALTRWRFSLLQLTDSTLNLGLHVMLVVQDLEQGLSLEVITSGIKTFYKYNYLVLQGYAFSVTIVSKVVYLLHLKTIS